MATHYQFDSEAAAQRRLREPQYRHFPSLWKTLPAHQTAFQKDWLEAARGEHSTAAVVTASNKLALFFHNEQPHLLYPYVWVRNALSPVPDAQGMHSWLHEVFVSYERSDMPDDAPLRFELGQLVNGRTKVRRDRALRRRA